MISEGDEDASFVADFENAAADVLQNDADLSTAFLHTQKPEESLVKKRVPIHKGRGKSSKGKGKVKGSWSGRKSLQQRILESNCRLCGRRGHWKSECPQKNQSTSATAASAPVTLSMGTHGDLDDVMPMEFMILPEVTETPTKDTITVESSCFVQSVFSSYQKQPQVRESSNDSMRVVRDRIRNYVKGNIANNSRVASLVSRIESRLCASAPDSKAKACDRGSIRKQSAFCTRNSTEAPKPVPCVQSAQVDFSRSCSAEAMIIDTGATKTVIGSHHVVQFL